ncbi:hypothetical protein [Nocardioides sp. GXZ039]|uniref:hypothetical protein n=1 Tax=Nocardioides sp. GXZ039 TaxID=3136018 RepID=UPI0030F376E4
MLEGGRAVTRLDLVVGPNGAGKSTVVDQILLPNLPHQAFVNADEIAKLYWPDEEVEKSLVAARLAAVLRTAFIALEEPSSPRPSSPTPRSSTWSVRRSPPATASISMC